jgi:hypothetical protein
MEAFKSCDALSEVHLPDRVVSIGNRAFAACYSLYDFTYPAQAVFGHGVLSLTAIPTPIIGQNGQSLIYVPNTVTQFKTPASILLVRGGAFENNLNLQEVELSDPVQFIGPWAFFGCFNLARVMMADSVEFIGEFAFGECIGMSKVELSSNLKRIGDYIFFSHNLQSIIIYPSVQSVSELAFYKSGIPVIYGVEGSFIEQWAYDHGATFIPLANTPADSNVVVSNPNAGVELVFSEVTIGGTTTITQLDAPIDDSYFYLDSAVGYYDIETTATFKDSVRVTIQYNHALLAESQSENELRLYQFKDGVPIDITESVDLENHIITGIVTDHFCVFAIGIPQQFMVTFQNWDGSILKTESVDYWEPAMAPDAPTLVGYTFTGWDVAFDRILDDLTVTAQFSINQYSITFNSAGGTPVAMITADYNAVVAAPIAPTKDGYTFTGWSPEFPATMPLNGTTLTAQWTINYLSIKACPSPSPV